MNRHYFLLILICFVVSACNSPHQTMEMPEAVGPETDPLPSWNETPAKKAIMDFVVNVTSEGDQYVPIEERIAVFDNDGTLWCEQPLYFEVVYSIAATMKIAETNPGLQKKPAVKALVTGDMKTFMQSGIKGVEEAFGISHAAVSPDAFNHMATAWLDTAVHKRFGKKYAELTYKPMVELLQYLRDNQFKTYIVSGGSSVFIRNFSEKAYNIPPEQVIGTMMKVKYDEKSRSIAFTPELWHNDDNTGKPEGIFQIIGRKPVLAFGNSDGDLQMLQYTSTNTLPNLSLILHHTDAEREYAYDRDSKVGRLDRALTEGQANGWIIVDMKNDFAKIFSFE